MTSPIVARVRDLKVHYALRGSHEQLKAVDGVSFELRAGEILGLVGESGCGKSSLGRALLRLVPATSGEIELDGEDFLKLNGEKLRRARPRIQMIFQDPYASLDPRLTVKEILAEPLLAHERLSRAELTRRIVEASDEVGLPSHALKRYPHEFSGGQRQRIAIARALMLRPKIVIADEPVSSLDVSVQAQILELLRNLQARLDLTIVFISHNLAVVKYVADRVAVMYLGKIVELRSRAELFSSPLHPYTEALISAVPIPDPRIERQRARIALQGDLPSPVHPPSGCAFHTRCPKALEICSVTPPQLEATAEGQWVSCHAATSRDQSEVAEQRKERLP